MEQTIRDKILELLNEPNTTDHYVVMGLIDFLDLEIDSYRGWHPRIYDSSDELKIRTKEQSIPEEYLEAIEKHNPVPNDKSSNSSIESKMEDENK